MLTTLMKLFAALFAFACSILLGLAADKPNIVLVMTDDQGWGQTGYYNHPVLKTPNLDAMAANGLRLDRFYAGAPNCSPTRGTVMTGRTNDRVGVENHGFPLRLQENPLPAALKKAGYVTGHFGKWHLNGYRGPGAPIPLEDDRNPGVYGFDEWISVSNFFDRDPLMSDRGKFVQFKGDSSEIIVDLAVKFIHKQAKGDQPFFTVIWYGSPHSPFDASDADRKPFPKLNNESSNHYGELVAMDRSIGTLRKGLRDAGVADNTLLWFNSDNGGLPRIEPETVGGLKGFKNSVYEGGLRVPCIIEWPAVIKPRISSYPSGTFDIFPTLADIVGLPDSAMVQPVDGVSLRPLFDQEIGPRKKPMGFRHTGRAAYIDNNIKLVTLKVGGKDFELYDLSNDNEEKHNLIEKNPELARKMIAAFQKWNASVDRSVAGKDYPEGKVSPDEPGARVWTQSPIYEPYFDQLRDRPEYKRYFNKPASR